MLKMLGSYISGDASDSLDRGHAQGNVLKAFWGNRNQGLQQQSPHRRQCFLRQLAALFRYKWKQWPFSQTKAESFDTLQRKLTRWSFPEPWKDGEEFFSLKGRESQKVREMCESSGWWSKGMDKQLSLMRIICVAVTTKACGHHICLKRVSVSLTMADRWWCAQLAP